MIEHPARPIPIRICCQLGIYVIILEIRERGEEMRNSLEITGPEVINFRGTCQNIKEYKSGK